MGYFGAAGSAVASLALLAPLPQERARRRRKGRVDGDAPVHGATRPQPASTGLWRWLLSNRHFGAAAATVGVSPLVTPMVTPESHQLSHVHLYLKATGDLPATRTAVD